ncbi:MAG: hypothetical protein ACR2QF_09685 [Geminicoccaceae bacterium]
MALSISPIKKPGKSFFASIFMGLLALFCLIADHRSAYAEDLSRFFGSFVGRAIVENLDTGEKQLRDLDIVVSPHQDDGLKIDWVTVGLVDGRRDVPGVKRWSQTAYFEPSEGAKFLIEVGEGNLFKERSEMEVIKGDPIRWSRIEGDTLHACSFVVLEDGRYELQVYQRILTEVGLEILFERIVDGEVVRRVTGSAVRAG